MSDARDERAKSSSAYQLALRKVLSDACARGKLLSKAAARREAEWLLRKPRVDRRLDIEQLAALRKRGFI